MGLLPRKSVYSGSFQISGTGTIDVEIGFEPDVVEFHGHPTGGNNVDESGTGESDVGNYIGGFDGIARSDGTQQVVHSGVSTNEPTTSSHYSSDSECIAIRYADDTGSSLGLLLGNVSSWNDTGFTVDISDYQQDEVVTFTAYRKRDGVR